MRRLFFFFFHEPNKHYRKKPNSVFFIIRFIERNCLSSLRGLSRAAPRLSTLDASGNRLTEVKVEAEAEAEGASSGGLPRSLETLRLSGNDLSGPEALRVLFLSREGEEGEGEGQGEGEGEGEAGSGESGGGGGDASPSLLPLLSTLDLSYCSITDAETVLSLLRSLPSLRALYLQGNPFWESLSGGRQGGGGGGRLAVLAACPLCAYLNDAPVFGDERAAADAWRESKGSSLEAARAAREAFLEAAALEAEKTTRLLERPPRFLRLVEEEAGDEEPDRSDSFDDEKRSEEGEEEKKKAEGAEPGGAAVGVVVVEEEA